MVIVAAFGTNRKLVNVSEKCHRDSGFLYLHMCQCKNLIFFLIMPLINKVALLKKSIFLYIELEAILLPKCLVFSLF